MAAGRSRTVVRSVMTTGVGLALAVAVLVMMEGIARIGVAAHQQRLELREASRNAAVLARGDPAAAPWAREYVEEASRIRTGWHPYVYWRLRPFHGRHITVDGQGNRRTWRAATFGVSARRVFMFGGSALWGIGARDDFTIPSLVSKRLNGVGESVQVTNFAQIGWVSSQGVIALMLELRRGNVPDAVVFYDGSNDVYSAFQHGIAGFTLNERHRALEFNLATEGDLRALVLRRLALYKVSERLVRTVRGRPAQQLPGEDPALAVSLPRDVVDIYIRNVELVNAWSQRYGFTAHFFWQPTLFTKQHLSPDEQQEMEGRRNRAVTAFGARVQEALDEGVAEGAIDNVYNLAHAFGGDGRTLFLDAVHTLEPANARVAAIIAERLLRQGFPRDATSKRF